MKVTIMPDDTPLFDPDDDRLRAAVLTIFNLDGSHPVGNYVGLMPVAGEGFRHHVRIDGETQLRHYRYEQLRIWINEEPNFEAL